MVYFNTTKVRATPGAVAPDEGGPTSPFAASTNPYVNALLSEYGQKWGGGTGTGVTLTYSFPWAHGDAPWDLDTTEVAAPQVYGPFSPEQQSLARQAMNTWSAVANITFVEVTETASEVGLVRFAFSSAVTSWGYASHPDNYWASGGDIWVNPDVNENWGANSYAAGALVHEIGHALGLKHPFEGAATLPKELDSSNFTLMSYTNPDSAWLLEPGATEYSWGLVKPMVYDILAIQYLYGANMSHNTGNDVYGYDAAKGFFDTIWDAGGHDLIDLSNFTADNAIDLREGAYSTVRGANWEGSGNLGIAFGAVIEDASGGSGNDIITGNAAGNLLRGNAGDDRIFGGDGNDVLHGGTGRNTLDGGNGLDAAAYDGAGAGYTVARSGGASVVTAKDGSSTDTLANIERLTFSDGVIALDAGGGEIAGSAYRLYQAAFDRVPDAEGLGYWIRQMDKGVGLGAVADSFLASSEFASTYGTAQSVSSANYVELLYTHTLGRSYDQGGFDYWVNRLDTHATGRGELLVFFSESGENQARVAEAISDGIWYV